MLLKNLPHLAVVALCATVIAAVRPGLASVASSVKARDDVYALPPATLLPRVSLGYRHALADMIWAHVLVTQGLRSQEKRPFHHLEDYLTAITTLDPKFREPYKYADTLLVYQQNDPDKVKHVRMARAIMEQGLRELPTDAELWLSYGEFLAYTAPGVFAEDMAERNRWRADGAAALMRAGELGSKDEYLMWHSVSAVGLLSDKEGEREALIHFLERLYALTQDPELREYVERNLGRLARDREESRFMKRSKAFEQVWKGLAFLTRTQLRVMGPTPDVWRCAGRQDGAEADSCARDWTAWGRALRLND